MSPGIAGANSSGSEVCDNRPVAKHPYATVVSGPLACPSDRRGTRTRESQVGETGNDPRLKSADHLEKQLHMSLRRPSAPALVGLPVLWFALAAGLFWVLESIVDAIAFSGGTVLERL